MSCQLWTTELQWLQGDCCHHQGSSQRWFQVKGRLCSCGCCCRKLSLQCLSAGLQLLHDGIKNTRFHLQEFSVFLNIDYEIYAEKCWNLKPLYLLLEVKMWRSCTLCKAKALRWSIFNLETGNTHNLHVVSVHTISVSGFEAAALSTWVNMYFPQSRWMNFIKDASVFSLSWRNVS